MLLPRFWRRRTAMYEPIMKRAEAPLVLSFTRNEAIPPLAWCLEATQGAREVTVCHGARVETAKDAFVEGAWDGPFADMSMDQGVCMGSGGRIRDGELVLISPSHLCEPLYSTRVGERLVVSNSLPFALVSAGLDLDPHYRYYLIDMRSIVHGLRNSVNIIPTLQGVPVERHYFCNLVIDRTLQVRRERKPQPPRFKTFADYRQYVKSTLERITRNANDSRRSFVYRLLATASRGYDSPACAVLAKDCGCQRALTISNGRGNTNDSGREMGELLFDQVIEREGQEYFHRPGMTEAEFVAMGDTGDTPLSSFEDVLPGSLLTTGFHGDKIWDPHNPDVGPDIRRGGAGGSSLVEFRLRLGFIHVPVPFIGCENYSDVRAIARSAEMDPWRIGGRYDRPVARRIVEEAGIPRHMFGQTKAAAATWWTLKATKAESEESYKQYRSAHRTSADKTKERAHWILFGLSQGWRFFSQQVTRVLRKLGIDVHIPQVVPARFVEHPTEAQLVPWGMSIVRQRYQFQRESRLSSAAEASTAVRRRRQER
jgi:hypothetical protein